SARNGAQLAAVHRAQRGMARTKLQRLIDSRAARTLRRPTLCSHDVFSPRILPGLDGIRIGQLSDIHVRTGVKPRMLHAAVGMLNALRPDLVVLTGDYVCLSVKPLPELTAALRKLAVPSYATLGNHDHWSDAKRVRQALTRAGVDVLTNEHRVLQFGRGHLHLV